MFRKRVESAEDAVMIPDAPARVVVTGDHPDAAELVARLVARAGHTVVRVESVDDLLAQLGEPGTGALVAVVAQHDTAATVIGAIRRHHDERVRTVPVVAVAAPHFADEDLAGADVVLRRPVPAASIVETLATVMTRRD